MSSSLPTGRCRRSIPILGIQAAVLRKPWAEGDPDQSFSLHEAIAAYTVEGAYARVHAEDRKGRLKPGYLADLVVLSGRYRGDAAGAAARTPPGHYSLRWQDKLPRVTMAGRELCDSLIQAGCQAAPHVVTIRENNLAAGESGQTVGRLRAGLAG